MHKESRVTPLWNFKDRITYINILIAVIQFYCHVEKSVHRARTRNTISRCGKARVGTPRCFVLIWIAWFYRMFFTFFPPLSFLFSKQFVTSIPNAHVRKRNISSSKRQPKNGFKEQCKMSKLSHHPVTFITEELIHVIQMYYKAPVTMPVCKRVF